MDDEFDATINIADSVIEANKGILLYTGHIISPYDLQSNFLSILSLLYS